MLEDEVGLIDQAQPTTESYSLVIQSNSFIHFLYPFNSYQGGIKLKKEILGLSIAMYCDSPYTTQSLHLAHTHTGLNLALTDSHPRKQAC